MENNYLEDLKLNLPDRQQIIGKNKKYFNSAVLVPLVKIKSEIHLLFQQRATGIRQANEICFPGGKYELNIDCNYKQTAIRETMEELGISKKKIKIIGKLGTIVAPMGATIDAFVGKLKISNLKELDLNHDEVADVFTIPISYFMNHKPKEYQVRTEIQPHYFNQEGEKITLLPAEELNLPPKYTTPWSGNKHSIYVYHTEKAIIWGITAELIVELIAKLD